MVTVGGSEAIDIALRAMLNPGDEVLIPQPSYVSYTPRTVLADGVPVTIQLEEKINSVLQRKTTREDHTENEGSDPSVPSITQPDPSWSRRIWRRSRRSVSKKDLFVISDEIYSRAYL